MKVIDSFETMFSRVTLSFSDLDYCYYIDGQYGYMCFDDVIFSNISRKIVKEDEARSLFERIKQLSC